MPIPLLFTGSNPNPEKLKENDSSAIHNTYVSSQGSNLSPEVNDEVNDCSAVHNMSSSDNLFNDEVQMPDTLSHDEDFELSPPLSSNKRKNRQNDEPQKKAKRKIYRPKVVSQFRKREKKLHPESSSTPKPSTPKQKRSYVRKTAKTSECQRPLFADDGDSISLPFLEIFKDSNVEQCGFKNSTITNESAIEYNSIQSYQKMASLSSLCLVESRRVRENFPITCKRKRVRREKISLVKLLPPFTKGKRSKNFIRKRKCWTEFYVEGSSTISRKMRSIIKKIISSKKKKHRKENKRDVRKKSGELVLYKKPVRKADIMFDEDTLRVWNLLVAESRHEEKDEQERRRWEEIREVYHKLVVSFLARVHTIQGDRRFLPWKGSVLDSVGGVFLTQNVSDHLSSSAYMTLAARFPIKPVSHEQSNNMNYSKVFLNKKTQNSSCSIERKSNSSSSKKQKHDKKKSKKDEENEEILKKKRQHWEALRKIHARSDRHIDHMDSIDWEAVRKANVLEVAEAIKQRGQHNIIALKIQLALEKFMNNHGSMDLEWLKDIPPKEAKEYLLDIFGLGLKSVECLRLLTLQHISFPVDVNVGRIVVRLGWVPLQPLPESVQIHNLELFPDPIKIQQYLWPRLCKLDHQTLYELHYQLITFGKVFCTKRSPNCNACPMKDECKYYASSLARTKLALPPNPTTDQSKEVNQIDQANAYSFPYSNCQSNSTSTEESKECEPIVEMPASPEPESTDLVDDEIKHDEDIYNDYTSENDEDIEDMTTFNLSSPESSCLPTLGYNSFEEFEYDIKINLNSQKLSRFKKMYDNSFKEFNHAVNPSTALVALHPNKANSHVPKMKNASRLKTERTVYVLTDNHPLLAKYPPREPDDPSPYLLVEWLPAELERSGESSKTDLHEEESSQNSTVPGTILIPCRTAMRAHFPLNGTYFQVNEVFADYASMKQPINVDRNWIWNLKKRIAYFGTGTSAITRGLSMGEIQNFFWNGYLCVRAIDIRTGAPRPISSILHRNTTARVRAGKGNKNVTPNEL